jgi:hopanoid biosynthesis associated protein HpnK
LKRLIVTADDFGASVNVNEAVEAASRNGILTAASLMVGAVAAGDAVARARRLPALRVGLHIVVVCGRPVLPAAQIPALVRTDGSFSENLLLTSLKIFFMPSARRQLEAEIRQQFEAFRTTGLRLDHVNAHNHLHLHPTILATIIRVGREFGMRAMRLPYEPLPNSLEEQKKLSLQAWLAAILLRPWVSLVKWRLRRAGIRYNDQIFGLRDTGHMDGKRTAEAISRLREGVSELYFHPSTRRVGHPFPVDYDSEAEFAALMDPALVTALEVAGVKRIAFSDLN